MKKMTLAQIVSITGAHLLNGNTSELSIAHIETDSRKPMSDAIFIALVGEQFDGHDYVEQAVAAGAKAVLVHKEQPVSVPQILVEDTLKALASLACYQRSVYQIPTVGLTGSCGKTTTKEMIAAILSTQGQVHATKGNLNNQFGVPFTLFNLNETDEFSVIEMGAGKTGDIDFLTRIALPDVVLITCIAEAHLEGMGSLAGIAKTKAEILHGLSDNGTAILPYDMRWLESWKQKVGANQTLLTFGLDKNADFFATDIANSDQGMHFELNYEGQILAVNLPLPGEHNVANALAAIAASHALGVPLSDCVSGLEIVTATAGRLTPKQGINGSQILDDTYNANPRAVVAAGKVLEQYAGNRVLVIGDMAELGTDSKAIHRQVGEELSALNIDQLLTVGQDSAYLAEGYGEGALHFNSKQSLTEFIKPKLHQDMVLVIKGSRSSAMETIVSELLAVQSNEQTEEAVSC